MKKELSDYKDLAREMVEEAGNLRLMQQGMDRMVHLEYELPEALRKFDWVRRFISSSPYEAIKAAVRALSSLMPRIKIEPISVTKALTEGEPVQGQKSKEQANAWEKSLLWALGLAEGRQGMLVSDVVRSALVYDEICGQIVYLPEQIKNIESMGGNANRYKAAKRYGDFAVIMRDPKCVYARYSDYMCESVLFVQAMTPQAIVDFWGDKADKIKSLIDKDSDDLPDSYILFDYCDYENHAVWAIPGDDADVAIREDSDNKSKHEVVLVKPTENKYPMLNGWVCLRGGTALESDPMYQRSPILFPVWKAEQWINTNVIGTLQQSEAIAEAAAPKLEINGPNADSVDFDYGEPGGVVRTPPGHTVKPLPQDGLDPALRDLFDRYEGIMNNATIARILTTADTNPGESFSAYNLRVNSAIGSLMPWRKLSERWLNECLKTMLFWVHYTKGELKGYGKKGKDEGNLYTIKGSDIDPDSLYMGVELVADVPTDRLQKVNAAIMMARELKYPTVKILEELGETDPEGALKDYWLEQFTGAAIAGKLQLVQAQAANQIEQMAAQMAQQMLQEAMAGAEQQMGQQPAAPPGGDPAAQGMAGAMGGMPPDMMGGMGMEGVEGGGFDAGMGGMPGVQANPEMAMGGTMGGLMQ